MSPWPVVDAGRIAYFAAATPASFGVTLVTVKNIGRDPLKLGQPNGSLWNVSANAGSDLSELCVGDFTTQCTNTLVAYDPQRGIPAGASLEIPVRITPNGLGARSFRMLLFSNDADEAVTDLSIRADSVMFPPCDVEITPIGTQDFGAVAAGETSELAFSLRNRLNGPNDVCFISSLRITNTMGLPAGAPPLFSFEGPMAFELAPEEVRLVRLRASPRGTFPGGRVVVQATLEFNVADPISSARQLPLSATVVNHCLEFAPARPNFGALAPMCSSPTMTIVASNVCAMDVNVTTADFSWSGSGTAPEFIASPGLAPSARISAGRQSAFGIRYAPSDLGADVARYVVNVTENGAPLTYVLALTGAGNTTGLNVDTIVPAPLRTDVLFVIDDSGSMAARQMAIGQNVNVLLQQAVARHVDFHLGVTNTELTDPTRGQLKTSPGGFKVLTTTTPNLSTEFQGLVNVGLSGFSESCMEPASRALSRSFLGDPTMNAGFVREDAKLAVVCVTDARDQAPDTASNYLARMSREKPLTYSVIGPFLPVAPPMCSYDDPNDMSHAYLIDNTGGVREEICTTDWAATIGRVGDALFGAHERYRLTVRPDPAALMGIEVRVNGTLVPTVHWNYDAMTNSIAFESIATPAPGSTITVSYLAPCL